MSFFSKLETAYSWTLTGGPVPLTGGLTHKMYRVETRQGTYALKLLNPYILRRETALDNFARAERLERLLERRGVPILPALERDGRKLREIDGTYFYLFDYFDGRPLRPEEVTPYHCALMGEVLAAIHDTDWINAREAYKPLSVDWDFYLSALEGTDWRLFERLRACRPLLEEIQEKANRARRRPPHILTVCHNDMDRKNVLWNGDDFRIIDLECLSYNDPMAELMELALCWSGCEECQIDFWRLRAFLQGYAGAGRQLPTDWQTLYDGSTGKLEWLEYNLKRVLGIDCGDDERQTGIGQVEETLRQILYRDRTRGQILECCYEYTKQASHRESYKP